MYVFLIMRTLFIMAQILKLLPFFLHTSYSHISLHLDFYEQRKFIAESELRRDSTWLELIHSMARQNHRWSIVIACLINSSYTDHPFDGCKLVILCVQKFICTIYNKILYKLELRAAEKLNLIIENTYKKKILFNFWKPKKLFKLWLMVADF